MSISRLSIKLMEKYLSDDLADPVYDCPACGNIGFTFDHVKILGHNAENSESCRVCGLPDFLFSDSDNWNICWKENGATNVSSLSLQERILYVNKIYDCMYRKKYFIPSEEDVRNKRLDKRVFTDNPNKLPFVKDDSKLTITNDRGEKWEFPYETNKIFELDNDKRYVMLIEESGYARLLASDHLAVRESPRMFYAGLTPDVFTFIGVFEPDCIFEDRNGVIYKACVAKHKREYVFEDDEFHRKVSSLLLRINEIQKGLPKEDFRDRGLLTFCIMGLESMDRRGDPSRYMPYNMIRIMENSEDRIESEAIRELLPELKEAVRDYKSLNRG